MKNPGTIPKEITPFHRISRDEIIGRSKELEILRTIFTTDQRSILLKGKDGIGKTTLAAIYATEFYDEYDHIVWLNNGDSIETSILTNFSLLSNLGILHSKSDHRIAECFRRLSSIHSDKPSLLIIDDANVNLSVYYDKLPAAPHWHVLVTSGERLSPFQLVELATLDEEEAMFLFRLHCKELADDQVRTIVCALHLHTLLIEVLAKNYSTHPITFEKVHQALTADTQKNITSSLLYGQKQEDKIRTFIIGISNLSDPGEHETWLLKQFLALPPDWIDAELLGQLLQVETLDWYRSLPDKLMALVSSGYLQNDPGTGSFRMHPILREGFLLKLSITPNDVMPLIEKISFMLNDPKEKDNPFIKFQFICYGEAILKVFPGSHLHEISSLQSKLGKAYKDLGEMEKARDLLEAALESEMENYGEKHPEIAVHQSDLANIYKDLGEYEEARDLFETALQSDVENFGENHPKVARHNSNLAHVYKDLGEFEKARDLLEHTLKMELRIYEPTHPFISQAQSNLATIYIQLGDYQKARNYLETALASDLANFGENHPSISAARSNLASIYRTLGEDEKARDLMEAALTSDLANLGEKHPNVAVSQSILANIYGVLGDHEKARSLWEKALRSNLENFGDNHPNVALCQSNLASVYSDLGDFEKARDLLEEALKSDLINFGEKHPYVALSQANLANVYYNIGEYEAARDLFEKTLQLHKVLYEPDHPFISQAQSNLANVYADLGEFDKARDLLVSTMESDKQKYGEMHPKVAVHQSNLANLYADFGETEKARELWASAYRILADTLGSEHPNTKAVKGFLDEIAADQSN